jgi:hypothetical protein
MVNIGHLVVIILYGENNFKNLKKKKIFSRFHFPSPGRFSLVSLFIAVMIYLRTTGGGKLVCSAAIEDVEILMVVFWQLRTGIRVDLIS